MSTGDVIRSVKELKANPEFIANFKDIEFAKDSIEAVTLKSETGQRIRIGMWGGSLCFTFYNSD